MSYSIKAHKMGLKMIQAYEEAIELCPAAENAKHELITDVGAVLYETVKPKESKERLKKWQMLAEMLRQHVALNNEKENAEGIKYKLEIAQEYIRGAKLDRDSWEKLKEIEEHIARRI